MASLPSSLALNNIADGASIVAADHRTNYTNIQTAVNALITALSSGAAGQALVASSASAIAWGAKTTVGTWAGGPPASPADTDFWIATAVDANGTRWVFQYNAGSASAYKWEFVGGAPAILTAGNANTVLTAATQVGATGYWYSPGAMSYTPSRAGDWLFEGQMSVDPNGGGAGDCTANTFIGTALGGLGIVVTTASTTAKTAVPVEIVNAAVAASQVCGIAFTTPANGTYKLYVQTLSVRPRRVA